MKSLSTLEGVSDGKLYDIKDMVKADAGGCEGCSACCHGIGEMVELTPFDVYDIRLHLNVSFDTLCADQLELLERNKIALPYLRMQDETEGCRFLNSENRCSIHGHRPNICRLFPLGRVYEENDFKYFLQVDACVKPSLGKIKVKKWIGIDNYNENKKFIIIWHQLLSALAFRMKFVRDEEELEAMKRYFLEMFYNIPFSENFYEVFGNRVVAAKNHLGII